MKKKLVFILFLMILAISSFDIAYATSENEGAAGDSRNGASGQYVYINPEYDGVIEEEDIALESSLQQKNLSRSNSVDAPDLSQFETDENKIIAALREAMVNRDETVALYFCSSNEIDDAQIESWIESALSETDSPVEGDYLRFSFGGLGYDVASAYDNNSYYYSVNMSFTYYSSYEQEQQLTAELESVMDGFNFTDSTSDYIKIKTIYDYICDNITYDYDNLNDDEYFLKFSAYAALINKTAVCQGYSTLLYRMLKAAGIDTRIITGVSNGENHAWNIVRIGDLYYYLDSTWDAGNDRYSYFLKGSAEFEGHESSPGFNEESFVAAYPISEKNYTSTDIPYTINKESITFYSGEIIGSFDSFETDPVEFGWPVEVYAELSVSHGKNHCEDVVWKSSNPDIVSVDADGIIKPVNHGTATVTGTAGGREYTCTVYVKDIQFFYWQVYTGEENSNHWVWDYAAVPVVGKDLLYKLEEVTYDSNMKESKRVDVTQKYPLTPADDSFMQITPGVIRALKEGSSQLDETQSSKVFCKLENTGVPYVPMIWFNIFTSGYDGDWLDGSMRIQHQYDETYEKVSEDGVLEAVPSKLEGFMSLDGEFTCIKEFYFLTPEELTWRSSDAAILSIDKVTGSKPGDIYSTANYSVHKSGNVTVTVFLNGKEMASLPITVEIVEQGQIDPSPGDGSGIDPAPAADPGNQGTGASTPSDDPGKQGTGASTPSTDPDNQGTDYSTPASDKQNEEAEYIADHTGTPKITLSKTGFTYKYKVRKVKNKKKAVPVVQKPSVKSVMLNGKTISAENYTVTWSNKKSSAIGEYTVTVTLKGQYSGKATAAYRINPKAVKLSKVKGAKKKFTATWKKLSNNDIKYKAITGYQIRYATKADFSNAKIIKAGSMKAVRKDVKKLKAKTKYYVQLRTYKKAGGKTFCSGWSKTKIVKTK